MKQNEPIDGNLGSFVKPQKNWEDLTDKEKMEQLKLDYNNYMESLFELIEQLNQKIEVLEDHYHLLDGTIVVKLKSIKIFC